MVEIQNNVELLPFNTFQLRSTARNFTVIHNREEVIELIQTKTFQKNKFFILGGGSNILLTQDFDGLVVKNEIKGIDVIAEDDNAVLLKVGSGESWHGLVMYCVARDLGGIENLSLIPGTCGAAPMQNIGAYGVEIKEVIHNVETIEIETGKVRVFSNAECKFGYRESIFKQELKDKYFISSITLTLTKKDHKFNISYGAIMDVLKSQKVEKVSVKAISDAVIEIRQKKLPDPKVIGNAGSFFKNPSVEKSVFEKIKADFPSVPSFPGENNLIKIPAGWMIEQNGWKGKTLENIGVHKDQALVLVNYGGGEGKNILALSQKIRESVLKKFNISLHAEVNII
jgi:UDP-N-acetylmuramate dehydrogenase